METIEVIRDRFYFCVCRGALPADRHDAHYFSLDDDECMRYWNFFLDYGPVSLGCLYRFCQIVRGKLSDKVLAGRRLYYCCSGKMNKRANAAYLVSAFSMLYLGKSPEEAYRPFQSSAPPLAPWHDASPGVDTFHLTTLDVLRGIAKARACSFFSFDSFNSDEYFYYEKVENGDMNWIVEGRFLAFAGPHDTRMSPAEGYHTTAVDDLIPLFRSKGVSAVIRLNKKYYNEKRFAAAGIDHYDMYYLDGSNPPEHILMRFLAVAESTTGAIAVHCKAGLGRTGTCIGAYLMKHYRFTAREAIGWMRVCRPGSVIGPQQEFLESIQTRMWEEGEAFRRVKALPAPAEWSLLSAAQAADARNSAPSPAPVDPIVSSVRPLPSRASSSRSTVSPPTDALAQLNLGSPTTSGGASSSSNNSVRALPTTPVQADAARPPTRPVASPITVWTSVAPSASSKRVVAPYTNASSSASAAIWTAQVRASASATSPARSSTRDALDDERDLRAGGSVTSSPSFRTQRPILGAASPLGGIADTNTASALAQLQLQARARAATGLGATASASSLRPTYSLGAASAAPARMSTLSSTSLSLLSASGSATHTGSQGDLLRSAKSRATTGLRSTKW